MAIIPVTGNTDNLKGTTGVDEFTIDDVTKLTAADKIDGKAGTDVLKFTASSSAVVTDAQFTGVISVETVKITNMGVDDITVGALAAKAGVNLIDGTDGSDGLKINAAAYSNAAGIAVLGTLGFANDFTGSQFGDRFTITAASISSVDKLEGGAGIDTLIFGGAGLTNNMFLNVHNFEVLAATGSGQDFEFGSFASAAGLSIVDGTNASGTLKVDASAHNGGVTLRGINKDTTVNFIGSTGDDLLVLQSTNVEQNTFSGASGGQSVLSDIIQYVGDGKTAFTVNDTQLANVTDVETLRVTGAPSVTVNLGANSDASGIFIVDGSTVSKTLTVDASNRSEGIQILSGAGVNLLTGGAGNDSFDFTSKGLTSADKIDGKAGDHDRLAITDKGAILDAVLAKVTNVEELAFVANLGVADYAGAKAVLGALSVAAEIVEVTNETNYGLTVDGAGRGTTHGLTFTSGIGNDVFVATPGGLSAGADSFDAGGGNDSLRTKLTALDGFDSYAGGYGTDEIRILDAQDAKNPATTKIEDGDFAHVTSVERLVFDATGHQDVTLGTGNIAEASGLKIVDASKVTGGLTLNAASLDTGIAVIAGSGADKIQLGGTGFLLQNDLYIAAAKLTVADMLDGGTADIRNLHFTDAAKLTDAFFATNTSHVTHFNTLLLDSATKGQSMAVGVGTAFDAFLTNSGVQQIAATSQDSATSFTFDFSKYAGSLSQVVGSGGNDIFLGGAANVAFAGGAGNDSFRYNSFEFANGVPTISGGSGANEIVILDAAGGVDDTFLANVEDVQTLRLGASKSKVDTYFVTLEAEAQAAGITTVDASLAGIDVYVFAITNYTADLTVLAGAKANTFLGGSGDDTLAIDVKTLAGDDSFAGGTGVDTLKLTTGGVVAAANMVSASEFEYLQLADAGNTITLSQNFVDGASSGSAVGPGFGAFTGPFDLVVKGGKGNDTIDGSAVDGSKSIAFVAGGGTDKLTGTQGDNAFYFVNAGDLTSADKVDGGSANPANDYDTVLAAAGVYSPDAFKGFKHIEALDLFAANAGQGSQVTIKNDFFANVDAVSDGTKQFTVRIDAHMTGNDTIDGSAVTGALNSLVMSDGSGGSDTFLGGAGMDSFHFAADDNGGYQLGSEDTVNGGGNLDTLVIHNDGSSVATALDDSALETVSSVERLEIAGNLDEKDVSVTLEENAVRNGILEVDAGDFGATNDAKFTLDATQFAGENGLKVTMGLGKNDIQLPGGVYNLVFVGTGTIDADDTIKGGNYYDRLVFNAQGTNDDSGFDNISGFEAIILEGKADNLTLTAKSNGTGVYTVNAAQALQGVTIDADVTSQSFLLIGSSFNDTLTVGAGVTGASFIGGAGGDLMKANGGDTFSYSSAADSQSRLDTLGQTSHLDVISGFQAGSKIIESVTEFSQVSPIIDSKMGIGALLTADEASWFANAPVVEQFDGTYTNLYMDANDNGSFEANIDLALRIEGDQRGLIDIQSSYPLSQPLVPELTENQAPPVFTAGAYTDDDFHAATNFDAIKLISATGDYSLTDLGANSEQNHLRFIDGRAVTGSLTIDASGRIEPVYIASGKGVNHLTGTQDNDIFYFTSAGLSATDTVNGLNPDKFPNYIFLDSNEDVLFITDKSSLVDAAFTNVSNVKTLEFGANPLPNGLVSDVTGQKVVLGVKSDAAGIEFVVNDYAIGLTVDVTARLNELRFEGGAGDDVFITNGNSDNRFYAGGGNDSFRTTLANLQAAAGDGGMSGESGNDELRILDSDNGKSAIVDFELNDFYSLERLAFDATGAQNVTLGHNADDSGLSIVDAAKITGGLTLHAEDMTNDLLVIAGSGADKIFAGKGFNHVSFVSGKLTAADTVDGGGFGALRFTDAVKLTDAYFAGLATNVTNFGYLELGSGAKGQSLTAGTNFANFVTHAGVTDIFATSDNPAATFTFDFSKYTGAALDVVGGNGNDVFLAGTTPMTFAGSDGDDSFRFSAANFAGSIFGGDGADEIVLLDAVGLTLVTPLSEALFADVHDVETLRLAATKTGEYHVVLGTNTDAAGIVKVDGSQAGVLVDIDASASGKDLTLMGGTKANNLTGGSGDDTFVMDAKTFGADDTIIGGASASGDTLRFSTGGVISTAAFAAGKIDGIEIIRFSDAGNSLLVTGAMLDQSDQNALLPSFPLHPYDLVVKGGKGNDTVDLSQIMDGDIAIIAGGGADKLTGGGGENTYIFEHAGDLGATDIVKGALGYDYLWIASGIYAVDAFKGVSSVEEVNILGDDDLAITLNNAVLAATNAELDGSHTFSIFDDQSAATTDITIDASAVTQANYRVFAFLGIGDETRFIGGAGDDRIEIVVDESNGSLITVAGGLGFDELELNPVGTLSDKSFAKVSSIEQLDLSVTSADLVLGKNAEAAGIAKLDASHVGVFGGGGGLTLDASAYTERLTVVASLGDHDDITLGAGDDTVDFGTDLVGNLDILLATTDKVNGGGGLDTLRFTGDTVLADSAFTNVVDFERIFLRSGAFDLTLDANFDGGSIDTIDAGKATGGLTLDASGMTRALTIIGSAAVDTIETGKGGDTITGGGGADVFKYTLATESHLGAGGSQTTLDTIADFQDGVDVIDLSAFGLTGAADVSSTVTTVPTADLNDLFTHAGTDVAVTLIGGDTYLFADADKSGSYELANDLVIKVVGSHVAELTF